MHYHHHTYLHEKFRKRMYDSYHYDAHPMGLLTSSIAGLSTFYPEAKQIEDPEVRHAQIVRLIAKLPTPVRQNRVGGGPSVRCGPTRPVGARRSSCSTTGIGPFGSTYSLRVRRSPDSRSAT